MRRCVAFWLLPFCFLVGCSSATPTGDGLELLGPAEVELPYEGSFDKNSFRVKLEAIRGEPDAIKVRADYDHGSGIESKDWTQHVGERVETTFNWKSGGAANYYLRFAERLVADGMVRKVKLSVQVKYRFAQ